jgi:Zn-dependent peptidase ImmA (M78 family)
MDMNFSQQRAHEIRRRYRFTRPCEIDRVLKAKNIQVVYFPLKGRVKEVIVLNFIGLPIELERHSCEEHELLAHALGHYLLHAGNQPFFHLDKKRVVAWQMEHQAWDFAFELLIPKAALARRLEKSGDEADLREQFQVSADFFKRRLQAFREDNPDT